MARVQVTRTYLDLVRPEDLAAAPSADPRLRLERVEQCPTSFHRADQARAYLDSPTVRLWVLYCAGAPAGYFELKRHDDGSVEIAYFGLLPEFKGRGFGKHMLTEATRQAWSWGAQRVWLHTCSLDDPAALPNYLARGFRPFKTEEYAIEMP
ncbi:MAG: GNAT family N-acetyltransferase [Acidobacteria bacterium]|nr:MAG: GNAT family N-acetyltransferase [Acidobacteriota bacterium]